MSDKMLSRRGLMGASLGVAVAAALPMAASARADEDASWDREVDVLVVGSGACGMMAAAYCAREGREVVVVEAADQTGGCSILSGGNCSWEAPFDLEGQEESEKLTVEEAIAHLTDPLNSVFKKNDPAVIRSHVENVPGTLEFILECGSKPQTNRTGSVAFPVYEEDPGPGLPRTFLGDDAPQTLGSGLMRPLEASCRGWGAEVMTGCKATDLISGEPGVCVGAQVETSDGPVRIHVRDAVVLGCGGWKGSAALRKAFDPRLTFDLSYTGYPYALDDGSALVAAMKIGACFSSDQSNDSQLFRTKYATPCYSFSAESGIAAPGIEVTGGQAGHYIYVNADGERFFDESVGTSCAEYADVFLRQPGHVAWTVFDADGLEACGWDITVPQSDGSCVFSAETVEGLAEAIGVPADALTATIASYNEAVEAGVDEKCGKATEKLEAPIATAPFYAVAMYTLVHDPLGGLLVDERRRVMDLDGKPFEGLYAGGDAAGGNCGAGHIARATVDGYIIGKSICEG